MNFHMILWGHKNKPYTDSVLPCLWKAFVLDRLHEETQWQNFLLKVVLGLIHCQIQLPKKNFKKYDHQKEKAPMVHRNSVMIEFFIPVAFSVILKALVRC